MAADKLTIRALRARAVDVPMALPLATGGGSVSTAPLALIDLETEEGVTGRAYLFCYAPRLLDPMVRLLEALEEVVKGATLAPAALEEKLQGAFRLAGPQGLGGMAISGIDMAAWDAFAKARGLPLVALLGGAARPLQAYNSRGLGLIGPERAAEEARALVEPGFTAVKVRLGYGDGAADLAVVRAVRAAIGPEVALMSDYNQCLSVIEAEQRIRLLDDEGLTWVEEPTRADDYAGCARIRAGARTPIQLGENCWGPHDMAKALDAGACDFFMPDLGKIGGVTGWLRAAALAEPIGLPVSSHLYPEVSAHLLAVTPTRHWLEYVDWASPILEQPLAIEAGKAQIPDRPGHGMAWDEAAVARHLA